LQDGQRILLVYIAITIGITGISGDTIEIEGNGVGIVQIRNNDFRVGAVEVGPFDRLRVVVRLVHLPGSPGVPLPCPVDHHAHKGQAYQPMRHSKSRLISIFHGVCLL
jgi:hypothetical protein